jgi:hypothetical protein
MGIEFKPIAKKHECKDGATLSIQASKYHYCTPRDNEGPYSTIEVGFIIDKDGEQITPPESWKVHADGEFPSDVYGYVPVELVQEFCDSHGGLKIHI